MSLIDIARDTLKGLSEMHTVPVWDGKYEEFGRRREVDVAALSDPTLINFQPPMRALRRFLVALMLICHSSLLFGQSTAFTYQGRLNDGSNPANGSYDLRFAVFDKSTNGNQQGPILTNGATSVSNGLFNVVLDFGNQFSGPDRWLEIAVRTNGNGNFITLSPRQPVTAIPYAITAANVLAGGIPSGIYTNAVIFSNPGNQFAGNGRELTNLNAANVFGTFTGDGSGLNSLQITNITASGTAGQVATYNGSTLALSNPAGGAAILNANLLQDSAGPSLSNKWWILAGDSLTSGYGGVTNYFSWATNWYGLTVSGFTNTAIVGQKANDVLSDFQNQIGRFCTNGNPVALWVGINDIGATHTAEDTFSSLTNLWFKIHTNGSPVVAFTITISAGWGGGNAVSKKNFERVRLNQMIRNSAGLWDRLIDVAAFIPTPGHSYCYLDGIHLNSEGHKLIGYEFSQILMRGTNWNHTPVEAMNYGPADAYVSEPLNNYFAGGGNNSGTTGIGNTGVGLGSLLHKVGGNGNTAIGEYTLSANISGTDNTAVGDYALSVDLGSWSTAVGGGALQQNMSGGANTAVGSYSLNGMTAGTQNVVVGGWALSTGNYNFVTVLGDHASLVNGASNSIVIGFNAVGTASNQTVIGNTNTVSTILYGQVTGIGGFVCPSNSWTANFNAFTNIYWNQPGAFGNFINSNGAAEFKIQVTATNTYTITLQ
jgi:hypothetical protein